jgi:hypothetical protein
MMLHLNEHCKKIMANQICMTLCKKNNENMGRLDQLNTKQWIKKWNFFTIKDKKLISITNNIQNITNNIIVIEFSSRKYTPFQKLWLVIYL